MFRKYRMGRMGGVLLYIKDTIPAYEVQLQEEADCNEAIWCKLVKVIGSQLLLTTNQVYLRYNVLCMNSLIDLGSKRNLRVRNFFY